MAFEHMEPWGFKPEQTRAGQVCAIIANVNRKKGTRAYKPDDFFVIESGGDGGRGRGVESAKSIHAKAAMITELYNAVVVKDHGDDRQSHN
jgi:hypothetical protein